MIRILLAAVLLLGLALGWALWRAEVHKGDAEKATTRADALAAQVADLKAASERDTVSATKTDEARASGEARTAEQTQRAARIEVKYRDRIIEVPAVCPDPDPDLVRELAEGAARVSATEGRLRGLRRAAGQAAE